MTRYFFPRSTLQGSFSSMQQLWHFKDHRPCMQMFIHKSCRLNKLKSTFVLPCLNADFKQWNNLLSFFLPQTQEVQKAMDQKRFEEAVKLRGRYDRQTWTSLSPVFLSAHRESGSRCYFRTPSVCCLHSVFSRMRKEGKNQDHGLHFQIHLP